MHPSHPWSFLAMVDDREMDILELPSSDSSHEIQSLLSHVRMSRRVLLNHHLQGVNLEPPHKLLHSRRLPTATIWCGCSIVEVGNGNNRLRRSDMWQEECLWVVQPYQRGALMTRPAPIFSFYAEA